MHLRGPQRTPIVMHAQEIAEEYILKTGLGFEKELLQPRLEEDEKTKRNDLGLRN